MKGRNPTAAEKRLHTMLAEEWRAVPGFGDHYEASSFGRVRAKAREVAKNTRYGGVMIQRYESRLLNPSTEKGYLRVHLGFDGKKTKAWVHTLVLLAFSRQPAEGEVCRHLNGVRDDNRPENLSWGSHLENMADRQAHGNYLTGERHAMAKLTREAVDLIRSSPLSGADLSRQLGIGQSQISRIRRGENWREGQ